MPDRDDAPLADEPQPGAIPDDQPTGLPADHPPEPEPLGGAEPDPDGEGERSRGDRAMPGIPSEGEPPDGG